MSFFEELIRFHFRYIISIPALLLSAPFTWVFDACTIYYPGIFRETNNLLNHENKVKRIQSQVKNWNENGRLLRMCTARPSWQTLSVRSLNKREFAKIEIDLEDIIEIDETNEVLYVEPGMKMGTLTYKLLSQGWTIPVIPEFESLTIGGCVNGTGIETSSHKYGLFADACLEYEVVLADGTLQTCSKDRNSDLFYAISWSHGTIGFLTGVKIQLLPAPKFVKVEYYPTLSIETAKILLSRQGYDFLEGIMFCLNSIVVMHGTMVEQADLSKINYINRWYKPWFYKHVESMLVSMKPQVEYIPARDYYHRHQRGYFWECAIAHPLANLPIIRHLIGWVFPLNFQFWKFVFSEYFWDLMFSDRHVLQDFMVPMSRMEETVKLSHNEVEVYPIWLCPCKFFHNPGLAHLPEGIDEMYIDIGVYGVSPKKRNFDNETKIRKLEKFVTEAKGFQFLYADTYMTREEFWRMFDLNHYERVRKKYDCEDAFPEVYDKISREARKR